MRFLHPEFLWLLALLPLLAILRGRRSAAPALVFSSTSIAAVLAEGRKTGPGGIIAALRLLGLGFLILAFARPQLGNTTTEIEASGIDILLAVDVSGSMEALDFTLKGKSANRLDVVKSVMHTFIMERPNDRIGLLAFSGRPYMVSPLTLDHDWLVQRLDSLSIGMIEDGTAIGSAIGSGLNRLRDRDAKSRIMILLTDGMNNAGTVPPLVAAEAAETLGIKVYTIGAGTRGEAPMPVKDRFGRKRLMRVRVDIDDETLGQVAEMTGGRYFRATDTKSLEKVYQEINTMETTTRNIKKFENYRELYSWFVFAALFFLGIEIMLGRRRLP
ncbi:Mg-chelatase subunit ChlD [Desulfocapsa sulfexigens DSM 10523]|uniref:Mg-chelatase subunit ChlD n=1 Tax=Desulfocapsa sulfexigens (strain DSM 10523 / SB164P1) TaxID=1167006 RepID=M1PLH6_DESSD|nr:VWA domain-containing protein [Desulfocapsa sulfexigens]AGF77321.1 Mg-chelatase subunit ChlD [Desulfocapsa sulfexigens DSM 10523]